jgi:hypothetical protein
MNSSVLSLSYGLVRRDQHARTFCAADPAPVLLDLETTERAWSQARRPGQEYIVKLLNEYRATWALIRQWAGHDAASRKERLKSKGLNGLFGTQPTRSNALASIKKQPN